MILVIDNYDSFTYNLVQYVGMCGAECEVVRNDAITMDKIAEMQPSGIMLSPGPCTPSESGICLEILKAALEPDGPIKGIPIFGVCLGHQAMGQVAGGEVARAHNIMHGKSSQIEHDGKGFLKDMPSPFNAIRYHSLIVKEESMPADFVVSARAMDDHEVMGMRHKTLPIEGVQFHPESVLTEHGITIVKNFVDATRG